VALLALAAADASAGWVSEEVAVPGEVTDVAAGDLDGDGLQDLVYTGPDGWGTAHQTPSGWLVETVEVESHGLVRTGDLDGDGLVDLLMEGPSHEVQYRLNNGSGEFVRVATATWYAGAYDLFSMELADTDGDGDVEAFYAEARNYASAPLYVAVWDQGNDVWSGPLSLFTDPVSGCGLTADTDAADVDADGDVDLLLGFSHDPSCAGSYEHRAMWFENIGSTFTWITHELTVDGDSAVQLSEISAVDVTLDGIPDIALAWSAAEDAAVDGMGRLSILTGLGSGTFGASTVAKNGPESTRAWLWTDVDDDADSDVVVAAENDGRSGVFWAPNRAGGDGGGVRVVDEVHANAMCVVDVDADDTSELAVAYDGGLRVYTDVP